MPFHAIGQRLCRCFNSAQSRNLRHVLTPSASELAAKHWLCAHTASCPAARAVRPISGSPAALPDLPPAPNHAPATSCTCPKPLLFREVVKLGDVVARLERAALAS